MGLKAGKMSKKATGTFLIDNPLGLHARPASLFVQMSSCFECDIKVENLNSATTANGKSLMSMLMLAAGNGAEIRITTDGVDATEALKALGDLIKRGFNEE